MYSSLRFILQGLTPFFKILNKNEYGILYLIGSRPIHRIKDIKIHSITTKQKTSNDMP